MEAVRQATTTVPIGAEDLETDPVASGLGERYSHPGGNLTGVVVCLISWIQALFW